MMRSFGFVLITVLLGVVARRVEPAQTRAESTDTHRDDLAGFEAKFRNEATDPRWSPAMSSAIQAALVSASGLHPLAHGVECRSHSCRIVIAEDGSGSLDGLVAKLARQVDRDLPSVVTGRVEHDGGPATLVLYLSRQATIL
jgi:hypothetical protein